MKKIFFATIILAASATGSYGQSNNLDGYYDNVQLEKIRLPQAPPDFIGQTVKKMQGEQEAKHYYRAPRAANVQPLQKVNTLGNELTLSHFTTPDLNTMDKPKSNPNWAKRAEFGFRF